MLATIQMNKVASYEELKASVDEAIDETLGNEIGVNQLTIACNYALAGGKRLRPVITLALFQSLQGRSADAAMKAALAMEFMHTASLVIDDLPFVLCGQGDPKPYAGSKNVDGGTGPENVYYKAPIHGKDRADYLCSLTALLAPR